ncbi:DUF4157 domain-containing protein [Anabaena sp. UHCC 0204]|nr:DUF4157 domain-containing protein [Anabaena sp. UHCC 0204]
MSMSPPSTPNIQRQGQEAWTTNINQKPIASSITPLVSRKPESEEEEAIQPKCDTCEQEEQIQRSPNLLQASSDGTTQAQPSLESRLNATKGGGSPLADGVRNFMEPRFGADFSQVRVHTGSEAVQMNRELGAQAFANGNDIYYGAGKTPGNNELTAHELTHVVQQTGGVQRQSIVQLSPLSEEVTQLWNPEQKAAFFHRLRRLDDSQRRDEDLRQWVDQHLRGNDRWLADNILLYGAEVNWPIALRVEREMQGWTDSGGSEAVFAILREAHGTEATNADLSDTLRRIFADNPEYLATAIQLQHHHQTAQDIDSNVMDLTYRRRTTEYDERSVRRIQQRLIDIGCLQETNEGFAWGQMNDATTQAIARFQTCHASEITQIQEDMEAIEALGTGDASSSARAAMRLQESEIQTNDVTHQALANAWPRRFFGVLLENQAQAYEYIANQVLQRSLPFDRQRVNIVGVRGFQGGGVHDNPRVRQRTNRYDDTFFILALNEQGETLLREFRGTTDPGGRTGYEQSSDPNTHQMGVDQQLNYHFSYTTSEKFNRPMLGQISGTPDHPGVIDPRRRSILKERGISEEDRRSSRIREENRQDRSPTSEMIPTGVEEKILYDRLRTEYGRNHLPRHPEYRGYDEQEFGIAIHSGGGWDSDQVTADSTGCQVVHGDWYGSFIQTLRRALTWERQRRGLAVPSDPQQLELVSQGDVLYSLLNGEDLIPPSAREASDAETCRCDDSLAREVRSPIL